MMLETVMLFELLGTRTLSVCLLTGVRELIAPVSPLDSSASSLQPLFSEQQPVYEDRVTALH